MIVELKSGASSYVKLSDLHRADGEAIAAVTSATAKIFLSSDAAKTALSNSSITLTQVDADTEPDAYHGTFPATVSMTVDTKYTVQVTIVADGLTMLFEEEAVAS